MIFVHSSFRVASTWLWSRFRQAEGTVAYYEIFNDQLAGLTRRRVKKMTPAAWYSKHPATGPYFLEFLPFIGKSGGVSGFDPAMAFDRFVPSSGPTGDIGADERVYIASLIAHADNRGKIPVLTSTRSLGRLAGIRRAFPGCHIVLYRNLFQQWCSYAEQFEHGNPHFLNTVKQMIEGSRHDRFLRAVHERWPFDHPDPTDQRQFVAFAAVHAYLYAHAVNDADLLIDVNRLADDSVYRAGVEDRIRMASGLTVNLAGAQNAIAGCAPGPGLTAELGESLRSMLNDALTEMPRNDSRAFAEKVINDFIGEQARHTHFGTSGAEALRTERRGVQHSAGWRLTEPVRMAQRWWRSEARRDKAGF